jgi:small subunit ribosomal protein S17
MTTTEDRGARKTREGIVVSDKMDKTVTVQVSDRVAHGTYSKVLSRSRKLKHMTKRILLAWAIVF